MAEPRARSRTRHRSRPAQDLVGRAVRAERQDRLAAQLPPRRLPGRRQDGPDQPPVGLGHVEAGAHAPGEQATLAPAGDPLFVGHGTARQRRLLRARVEHGAAPSCLAVSEISLASARLRAIPTVIETPTTSMIPSGIRPADR